MIVKSTAKNLYPINADFAVRLPSGFVGETHIFVTNATKGRSMASTCLEFLRISSRNVKGSRSAQLVADMPKTANNTV